MTFVSIDHRKFKVLLDFVSFDKSAEAQEAWLHGMDLLAWAQKASGEYDADVFEYIMKKADNENKEGFRSQFNFRMFDNNKRKDEPNG